MGTALTLPNRTDIESHEGADALLDAMHHACFASTMRIAMQPPRISIGFLLLLFTVQAVQFCSSQQNREWTDSFPEDSASLSSLGANPYFILELGYQMHLKGKEGTRSADLIITVLNETVFVDGIQTRIVEERETVGDELVEVSKNFFAISKRTNGVYYFGEEVDMYRRDKIVSHEGSWRSGVKGARYGLFIPGVPLLGSRYYQELAPDVAMDRSEVISMNERVQTNAGTYENCLKTEETTPLEPEVMEYKYYAKGIGLIQDGALSLASHGFIKK